VADCRYAVGDLTASGDALYGSQIANQPFINWAWDVFEFDYDWWQDGWGYDDCVNVTKPLGRTFNAIWALTYSAERIWQPMDVNRNMLEWGGRWAAGQIQGYALRARCGDKVATTYGAGCTEYRHTVLWDCTQQERRGHKECRSWFFLFAWICHIFVTVYSWVCIAWGWVASLVCAAAVGIFGSKHIDLQQTAFFYGKPAVGRSSTFIHEARHISGKAHTADFPAGSSYGSGSGADESWEFNGAWRWQAVWLAWYASTAVNSTPALRAKARDDANVIMLGAFATSPGITF
jgi:hypothetical protein